MGKSTFPQGCARRRVSERNRLKGGSWRGDEGMGGCAAGEAQVNGVKGGSRPSPTRINYIQHFALSAFNFPLPGGIAARRNRCPEESLPGGIAARKSAHRSKTLTTSVGPSSRMASTASLPETVIFSVPPRLWTVSFPPGSLPCAHSVTATLPVPVPQARV